MNERERHLAAVPAEPLSTAEAVMAFRCSWPECTNGPVELIEDLDGVERLACSVHKSVIGSWQRTLVIDPPPVAALHELAAALETVGQSDEWVSGWDACREGMVVEMAEQVVEAFERGRLARQPRGLPLWVPLVATLACVAAFVLGAALS